jgi:hypothetical protein
MRHLVLAVVLAPGIVLPAAAQTATATLSADLGPVVRLSLSASTLTFPDADPDLAPYVMPAGGPIVITTRARAAAGTQVLLTVQAGDHLRSGASTIDIGHLEWSAAGSGYFGGTLSRDLPQPVGSWIGSGMREGTQTFRFRNLWTHPAGIFTVTLIYTLSAP